MEELLGYLFVFTPVILSIIGTIIIFKIHRRQLKRRAEYEKEMADYQAKQIATELYKLQQQDKLDPEIEELIKQIEKE